MVDGCIMGDGAHVPRVDVLRGNRSSKVTDHLTPESDATDQLFE